MQERYRLDVYYVEHFSLLMDLKIILRTVGVVLLVRRKKKLSKRIEEEAADETAEETDSGESDEGDEE